MIIMAMSIVTLAQASRSYIARTLRNGVLVGLVGVCLGTGAAHAHNATWLLKPGSGNWNTAANWMPATVPTGTATFGASNTTTIGFSSIVNNSVGALVFNPGAPAYSFNIPSFTGLTITGTGVVNDSSNRPNFSITASGSIGLTFENGSTAGNAIITINSGGRTLFGIVGQFQNRTTAGTATITTNSGGETEFFGSSTGGHARFITNSGGIFGISGLSSSGMSAGSIEGAGTYRLGSKALTVGLNNLSTQVSGTIADGGVFGGTGGSLIKVGSGTLTLSGPNTYSGGTILSSGNLTVGSSQALGTGNVTVNEGVLRADSPPINVKGNYIQDGGILQLRVDGANPGQYDSLKVRGNAALGGTLQLFSLGFQPKVGNQLTLVTTGGVLEPICPVYRPIWYRAWI
jgi:autotransporter-associated beta strand protein